MNFLNCKKMEFRICFISIFILITASIFSIGLSAQNPYALAIHGGAGVMSRADMGAERQHEYTYHLDKALTIGDSILRNGGSSTDAVVRVVSYLEDCPLFNAGKGAVFTHRGTVELDASIMDGATLNAGAIAGVTNIKNPIKAVRLVMDKSEHVMLSGKGASAFARKQGLKMVKNRYFFTKERYESLKRLQKQDRVRNQNDNHGTVGCVALDQQGNLCAGTSTGGMMKKKYGRIGDSPIIGAGTWADNRTCAVSSTGHGEYFIRLTVARDVASLMEYKNMDISQAGNTVLEKLTKIGGTGGFIAIDTNGNISMPFNTSGMFRGYAKSTGEKEIAIFAP
jgi:beta-aspartyl-peptidase (threonine type)